LNQSIAAIQSGRYPLAIEATSVNASLLSSQQYRVSATYRISRENIATIEALNLKDEWDAIMLEQTLPSDAIIDPNELDSLRLVKGVSHVQLAQHQTGLSTPQMTSHIHVSL
jgi:hypothetical protein